MQAAFPELGAEVRQPIGVVQDLLTHALDLPASDVFQVLSLG